MTFLSETICGRRSMFAGFAGAASLYAFRCAPAWTQKVPSADTQLLNRMIAAGGGKVITIDRDYRVGAPDNHFFSDKHSDPQSSALTVKSSTTIDGRGSSRIIGITPDKSVIQVYDGAHPVDHVVVRNLHIKQPDSRILGGDGKNHGLTDDYFALRFNGASYCEASGIVIDTCALGITFQYNEYAMPSDPASRASRYNRSSNIEIRRCTYMGLQLAGDAFGSHTNYLMHGESKSGGGRASSHAVRFVGYVAASVQAPCSKNQVTGHVVDGFADAVSIQQWCRDNTIEVTSRNCQNGVSITRQQRNSPYGAPGDATAQQNQITIKHEGGNFGIYNDGGSHNQFDVQITGTSMGGINERPSMGTPGLSVGNTYRGSILQPGKRGAHLAGDETEIDLDITGNNVATTNFGCMVMGPRARGRAAVRNCKIGVLVSGVRAVLSIKVNSCSLAMAVTGDGNTLNCDIDGDVMVSGNYNKLIGRVRGNVRVQPSSIGNEVRVARS